MTVDQAYVARAFCPADLPDPLAHAAQQLGAGPFALVVLFLSPELDLARIASEVPQVFGPTPVIGCTTAGEIGGAGYAAGGLVALGFHRRHFAAETLLITDLSAASAADLTDALIRLRNGLARAHPDLGQECALLLVDGLSVQGDALTASLAAGASAMPVMGGSAGDGARFEQTFVLQDGRLCRHAAVLAVLRTDCLLQTFCSDHLEPSEIRLVVTEADPAARVVQRFNGAPAAAEYARLLGLTVDQIDPFTCARHPLAVRLGPRHHVRAVRRCLPTEGLEFFSAVDKGVVLSVSHPRDPLPHLQSVLEGLAAPQAPVAILAFDCILRRIELEQRQQIGQASALLARHRVVGFNTYGEQVGSLHVNQTFSGYAFYPPAPPGGKGG